MSINIEAFRKDKDYICVHNKVYTMEEYIERVDILEAQMKELKAKNERLRIRIKELERKEEEKKQLKTEIKHKNQLWKSAFKAYKKLKNKVEKNLFPVEYIDFICGTGIQRYPDEDIVVYDFSMPWFKVKEYLNKKYKRGEK